MKKDFGKLLIGLILLFSVNFLMGSTFSTFGNNTKTINKDRIELSDLKGNEMVYTLKGNKIILVVSASCEECMNELKWLSNQNEFLQKRVDLVSVSDLEETKRIVNRFNLKGNVYLDSKKDFSLKYEIVATPVIYTINNGTVAKYSQKLEDLLNI